MEGIMAETKKKTSAKKNTSAKTKTLTSKNKVNTTKKTTKSKDKETKKVTQKNQTKLNKEPKQNRNSKNNKKVVKKEEKKSFKEKVNSVTSSITKKVSKVFSRKKTEKKNQSNKKKKKIKLKEFFSNLFKKKDKKVANNKKEKSKKQSFFNKNIKKIFIILAIICGIILLLEGIYVIVHKINIENKTVYYDAMNSITIDDSNTIAVGSSNFRYSENYSHTQGLEKGRIIKYDKNGKIVFEKMYEKGINTYCSNYEVETGYCYIAINYNSLSPENKKNIIRTFKKKSRSL